jgi:hypothetical protein
MSNQVKVTLLPEIDEIKSLLENESFLGECEEHVRNIGYSAKNSGDRVCIFYLGESSCQQGTLVGWRYVSEVESFVKNRVSAWLFSSERIPSEISLIWAAVSEVAICVSKRIASNEN